LTPLLLGVLAYVGAQLAVGVWVSRRIATEEDFFVAGRRLGLVFASASIFATWFGAETCVGAAGQVYAEGIGRRSVEPFAYGVCLILMGIVFAAPLWRRRIVTLADFLRERYSKGVERIAAVLLIPTSLLWAAAQVRAFGHVLSASSSGLDIEAAMGIAAAIVIVYTALGGLYADVVTDVVQAAALILGLLVLAFIVLQDLGGTAGAAEAIASTNAARPIARTGWLATAEAWAIPLCGSVVAQEVVSRSVAARSAAVARSAGIAGGFAYLAVGLLPVFLGLVGPSLSPGLEDGEALLPELARTHLSTWLYVVFAGGLVSAILSTADSALLVASSLLSRNLLLEGGRASDRQRLLAARAGVVLFGLLAWLLATRSEGVFELVESASGFGSAGILVVVSFGLFGRIGGSKSAAAALIAGIAVWLYGTQLAELLTPYLLSLGAALASYLGAAVVDRFARKD
jgi:Na+/proline symporter